MALPKTMRAIVPRGIGAPEVLEWVDQPMPVPGAEDVLIRVAAAGVNFADVLQRQGRYPIPVKGSPIPGLEVAGEIVRLGANVRDRRVGERVVTLVSGGAYAEYCTAPAAQVLPWPHGFDAVHAASLPESLMTVWANVFCMGRLCAGETLLVHGGRGGIGTTAIQLARAFGAHVWATSGSAEGCADCVRLGADGAINYRSADFVDKIMAATSGRGADVILDPIGAANFNRNLAALTQDGRLVLIGFTGGAVVEQVDLTRILARRLVVTGSALRPRSVAEKAEIAADLIKQVWPLLERGECAPVIAGVFPLRAAAAAHQRMEAGGYFGKIVLKAAD